MGVPGIVPGDTRSVKRWLFDRGRASATTLVMIVPIAPAVLNDLVWHHPDSDERLIAARNMMCFVVLNVGDVKKRF